MDFDNNNLLKEIDNILVTDRSDDFDIISLYDVIRVVSEKKNSFYELMNDYCSKISKDKNTKVTDYYFFGNYENNKLTFGFKYNYEYYFATFLKNNDNLYLLKEEPVGFGNFLNVLFNNNLFDDLVSYTKFYLQHSYEINSCNSNFSIDIDRHGVSVSYEAKSINLSYKFLVLSSSEEGKYEYAKGLNQKIISSLIGKEDDLFSNIFINISDCPEWSQDIFRDVRLSKLGKGKKRIKEC